MAAAPKGPLSPPKVQGATWHFGLIRPGYSIRRHIQDHFVGAKRVGQASSQAPPPSLAGLQLS